MVLKHADTMKPEDFISRHLRWTRDPMEMRRINARRAQIYAEVLEQSADGGALHLLDGVLPFLNLLRGNKVPMAVTCNTYNFSELCDVLKELRIYEFFEHDTPGEPHVVGWEKGMGGAAFWSVFARESRRVFSSSVDLRERRQNI